MPPRDDPMEQTLPPGTILEFGQRITRVETRMDSLERTVDTGFEQVMTRLNEGSQKFAIQNGKINALKGKQTSWQGAVKFVGYLLPVLISALALLKVFGVF